MNDSLTHGEDYLDAAAQGEQKGTIFLIHGFPDLSLGWRYQIPMLTELGFRCIAIDCMGYGNTVCLHLVELAVQMMFQLII